MGSRKVGALLTGPRLPLVNGDPVGSFAHVEVEIIDVSRAGSFVGKVPHHSGQTPRLAAHAAADQKTAVARDDNREDYREQHQDHAQLDERESIARGSTSNS